MRNVINPLAHGIAVILAGLAAFGPVQDARSDQPDPWQSGASLQPLSTTAIAITGPIKVDGNTISFGPKSVPAALLGRFWQPWELLRDRKITGTVYKLDADPGVLLNGNRLCGPDIAHYIVLWRSDDRLTGPAVTLAAFSSEEIPQDINSAGLCGTYSYVVPNG